MRCSVRLWHMIAGVLTGHSMTGDDGDAAYGLYNKAREATRNGITDEPIAIPLSLGEDLLLHRMLADNIERGTALGKCAQEGGIELD